MLTGLKLLLQSLWPDGPSVQVDKGDPLHPSQRRLTSSYRRKQKTVKVLWIATGLMMMAYPLVHFIVTLGLFTTFLSFTILDESR